MNKRFDHLKKASIHKYSCKVAVVTVAFTFPVVLIKYPVIGGIFIRLTLY